MNPKRILQIEKCKMQNAKSRAGRSLSPLPTSRSPAPRGILLILVLAVLALLAMIAVALVVVSNHARMSSESMMRFEQVTDPPEKLLRQAAMQVFRGPKSFPNGDPDLASVMGAHSLLEDIYGNEYVLGELSATVPATYASSGAFRQLMVLPIDSLLYYNVTTGLLQTYNAWSRRVGCVLTITGVPSLANDAQKALLGQSTRIVATDSSGTLTVVSFSNLPINVFPPAGTEFTINSVPFSGTGFGYNSDYDKDNPLTGKTPLSLARDPVSGDLKKNVAAESDWDSLWPVALLPNDAANRNPESNGGGANEDYDAPDFQNMLLAAQVPRYGNPSNTHEVTAVQTLPSLHRPALVRYWFQHLAGTDYDSLWPGVPDHNDRIQAMTYPYGPDCIPGTLDDPPALHPTIVAAKRSFISRPLQEDHPNFTGSNPNFNPGWSQMGSAGIWYSGQWDVDNDGDGVPDSVWVDLGMPVRRTADGRLYKPLFAILCVDLDGRVNLNAHGSLPQTDPNYATTMTLPMGGSFAGGGTPVPCGQGVGPADINPYYFFGSKTYAQQLMTGYNSYEGRYGDDYGSTAWPGSSGSDTLSANKWFNYGAGRINNGVAPYACGYYWNFTDIDYAGSYGSPIDVYGVGAVGLDMAGRPIYAGMTDSPPSSLYWGFGQGMVNSPYELNLDANQTRGQPSYLNTVDNPFSPTELERILRPYDVDAPSLPDRLAQLTTPTASPNDSILYNARHSVTTESWDLPCPNVVTPPSMADAERTLIGGRVKHITDLLRARGVTEDHFAELLPPDLLAGLRMNINRPFGDGQDDPASPNGVVDEQWPAETDTLFGGTVSFSYDGSNLQATNSLQARQLEARFLYVLAMLVADTDEIKTKNGWNDAELARFLAQWAVNVVDFKDRDSIMTPFEYDVNPFDNDDTSADGSTWDVDGILGTPSTDDSSLYRGLVWGCERPELLISETLAFHDRRTEDLTNYGYVDPPTAGDSKETEEADNVNDFDQSYRPQGSLFVELYNPTSSLGPCSADFYTLSNGSLELTKTTGGSPIWRLVIAVPTGAAEQPDPDDPDPAATQPDVEREVYFVPSSAATVLPALPGADPQERYYPNTAQTVNISPGNYAVIGPGEASSKRTYIGQPTTPTTPDNEKRYIDLTTGLASFPVHNNTNLTPPAEPTTSQANIPEVLAIDSPRRLSVSEPKDGYGSMETAGGPDGNGKYATPYDVPFDSQRPDGINVFKVNGTREKYRVIYLQRLANPLMPYNEDTNPYRTIDMMAVDVTAFNGIASDATDPHQVGNTLVTHFQSRQRGESNDSYIDTSTGNHSNLWKQEPIDKTFGADALDLAAPITTHYFNKGLKHSLGYLNQPYGTPVDGSTGGFKGGPAQPFPWLTWLNRPYTSPYELMQVSWLRSSQLLAETHFRLAQAADDPYTNPSQPFSHLMNFFPSGPTTAPDEELHRVFEYLGVPSPFVGTETQANPNFATGAGHNFRPPFNGISTYREPGRINLNTIYSKWVFAALKNGSLSNVSWSRFVQSRRGYTAFIASNVLAQDNNYQYPTEFSKPFRSFGGADMVPTLSTTATDDVLKYDKEIDATILREGTANTPLFQGTSTDPADNVNRNPYFRYQGIQRLGNLVTTRSNVYAVWITVGYFEVEEPPASSNPSLYPDGYALARELGMDTGEIERHRAFYIFDRSIPVAFQRGQDLNIDKAILVDRFIE